MQTNNYYSVEILTENHISIYKFLLLSDLNVWFFTNDQYLIPHHRNALKK